MKRIILFVTIALLHFLLNAEYTFQYAPQTGYATDFETSDITSDFGRRLCAGSKWHKGVDFKQTIGSHLLALDSGVVYDITIASDSLYKVIKIDCDSLDYGYGHIFHDGHPDSINIELAGMKLKRMKTPCNHLF